MDPCYRAKVLVDLQTLEKLKNSNMCFQIYDDIQKVNCNFLELVNKSIIYYFITKATDDVPSNFCSTLYWTRQQSVCCFYFKFGFIVSTFILILHRDRCHCQCPGRQRQEHNGHSRDRHNDVWQVKYEDILRNSNHGFQLDLSRLVVLGVGTRPWPWLSHVCRIMCRSCSATCEPPNQCCLSVCLVTPLAVHLMTSRANIWDFEQSYIDSVNVNLNKDMNVWLWLCFGYFEF